MRIKHLAILLIVVWTLLPVLWMLRLAFMTPGELAAYPPNIFPPSPQLGSFYNILGHDFTTRDGIVLHASGQASQIIAGLMNSLVVGLIVTVITIAVVVPLAYTFARLEFRFKNVLLFAVLLSVSQPPVSTLIPFFALYIDLGLVGTRTGLVIVTLTITIPLVTWMLIGYFRNIPPIEKLARIDGFGRGYTLLRIVVPMAKGGIAVAALISFLLSWNEYVYAVVLVSGSSAVTLPAAMSGFLFQQPEPSHLAAAMWIAVIPPTLLGFILQRHIADMHLGDPLN
ncbi:carbohydrate ABC transporter permease [Mesorhizobium sp. M3A.F.Ca.ET.201.01.1.1]|uniref:carbohydrate ABC transporter permease n=1 Tax=Mesorhizobium sp. M3A.F.Ca.ET.201.01.1.1 TaxID=2563946 RepID=UPI0010935C07|nr:carbohydrate ABC transporter permease [Mesorhizobium sp. M3A.F.Ca.ET.201.01.1.1]TGS71735.1 carbohydrate ABC transporter permease [Mesorhizobium sp. M3A.F.Ca.ET.201.01.1.1]